jgi:hypothetical protein
MIPSSRPVAARASPGRRGRRDVPADPLRDGSVAAAVLTGAQLGLWQVAVVWGFGVALAIYCSVGLSGARLNPAVSLAFALLRPASFPARRCRRAPATYWWCAASTCRAT